MVILQCDSLVLLETLGPKGQGRLGKERKDKDRNLAKSDRGRTGKHSGSCSQGGKSMFLFISP